MRLQFAFALLIASTPLFAAPSAVQVQDLGSLGGCPFPVGVGASGFGRNGTVVGRTHKLGVGDVPFAWTSDSGIRVISDTPGFAAAANGIGQVAGTLQPEEGPQQAFLWTPPASLTLISAPQANAITPQVMNDLGQVAGVVDLIGGEQHAFLWSAADGFKDLGSLGGSTLTVTDITENGLVVGHARLLNGEDRAFQWRNGGMIRELGTLGGNLSYAMAANEEGMVVGYSRTPDNNIHGFLYHKGKMTPLASPTIQSAAYAINEGGSIVGSGVDYGTNRAMLWSPAGVPQEIVGADIAVGINDAGVVAAYSGTGSGQSRRAHLWSTATGLLTPDDFEHDASSQAIGVTADGRLVSLREDWSGVRKAFVWSPSTGRALLDGLGGGYGRALHVNASGQVAGFSRTVLGYDRAFLWTPDGSGGGSMAEIPAPAGWHSTPVALNAAGAVAGSTFKAPGGFYTSGPSFFWPGNGETYSDLGQVSVVDVNDAGQVLGYQYPVSAFIWKAGAFTNLPPMGQGQIVPADINNMGQVVGRFNIDPWTIHAFSWKPGASPVDLGTLGGSYSEAVAVNDDGQIAGNSNLSGDSVSHAFRTVGGKKLIDLGALSAGGESTAMGMNKNGVVVGSSTLDDGSAFHAFLYDTRMRDLGDLVDPNGQFKAINDLKDVVGWRLAGESYEPRAFLSVAGAPIVDLPGLGGEISRAFAINAGGVAVGDALTLDGQQRAVLWRTR